MKKFEDLPSNIGKVSAVKCKLCAHNYNFVNPYYNTCAKKVADREKSSSHMMSEALMTNFPKYNRTIAALCELFPTHLDQNDLPRACRVCGVDFDQPWAPHQYCKADRTEKFRFHNPHRFLPPKISKKDIRTATCERLKTILTIFMKVYLQLLIIKLDLYYATRFLLNTVY